MGQPLVSTLTTNPDLCLDAAKLDAASHCWVDSFANYNFQLYYRIERTNIDADALSRVSWLGNIPNTSDMHIQVTAVAV